MKGINAECGMRNADLQRRCKGFLPHFEIRTPQFAIAAFCLVLLFAVSASGQDEVVKLVEAKRIELNAREETLKREEARLNALRKDVDGRIASYSAIVAKLEAVLARLERVEGDKIENVVKAYEIMPAEDAAARLSALDRETALRIMTRMKSKKAGAIMAVMEPKKAAALTESMTRHTIKNKTP